MNIVVAMTDLQTLALTLRLRREELIGELQDIDETLQSVDEGCYGLCAQCGQAISVARLGMHPATRWCQSCKIDYERRRGFVESSDSVPLFQTQTVGDS